MQLLPFERRWILTIFDTIYPGGHPVLPWKASEVATTGPFVDDMFRVGPFWTILGMRALIWIMNWVGPLLALGLPLPFAWISDAARLRTLENLAGSRFYLVREIPTLFKMLGSMAYCASADVQKAVGFERPDFGLPAWVNEVSRG